MFAIRLRRRLTDRHLLAAGVRGGLIGVPIFAGIVFVTAWASGSGIPMPAPIHGHPPPMSAGAAGEGLLVTLAAVVILGLPVFVVGAMLGAVVAIVRRAIVGHESRTASSP